jgi:hypothetical protein
VVQHFQPPEVEPPPPSATTLHRFLLDFSTRWMKLCPIGPFANTNEKVVLFIPHLSLEMMFSLTCAALNFKFDFAVTKGCTYQSQDGC